jgi:hypothetical protein
VLLGAIGDGMTTRRQILANARSRMAGTKHGREPDQGEKSQGKREGLFHESDPFSQAMVFVTGRHCPNTQNIMVIRQSGHRSFFDRKI